MKHFTPLTKIALSIALICALLPAFTGHVLADPTVFIYLYDDIANNWSGNGVSGTFREGETDVWIFSRAAGFTGDNEYKIYNLANNSDNDFTQPADSMVWSGDIAAVNSTTPSTITSYADPAAPAGKYPVTAGNYYTFTFNDVITDTNTLGFVFETSNPPVSITSVTQSPITAEVADSDVVNVTVTLNAQPSPEEKVYLRYTTNGWLTSTAILIPSFDAQFRATVSIPAQAPQTQVTYYILTTTIDSASWGSYLNLMTINVNNGGGFGYTYITKWGTKADGPWSSPDTWTTGVPNDRGKSALIAHNVYMDTDVAIRSLTIRSEGGLTAGDAFIRTLTIADTRTAGLANFYNRGSFLHANGKVVFEGAGMVSGAVTFNDVDLPNYAGPSQDGERGVNFGSASTVEGTLSIGSRRFVSSNGPTYTSTSRLVYQTGSIYGVRSEWSTNTSGRGVPYEIEIMSGTTLSITQEWGDRTALGDLSIHGSLKASQESNILLHGNWTNNGSFTPYGSGVVLAGTSLQSLGGTSSTTFNNLTIDNPAGASLDTTATVTRTLALNNGSFSLPAGLSLVDGVTIVRAAGSLSAAPSFGTSVNVIYTGATGVSTGPELPTAVSVLNNLTIENSGGVSLAQNQTVNGSFSVAAGNFAVNAWTLTLHGPAAATGGSLSSAANGTVIYNQGLDGQNVLTGSYGNLALNNFNKVFSASGVTGISNTFTPGAAGGHTINGSTIEFNGTLPQTLPSGFLTYDNLSLNNPSTVNGIPGLVVNELLDVQQGQFNTSSTFNDVQIASGATLAAGGDISISGDFTNQGDFFHNNHTVTFDGAGIQNLTAHQPTTFYNLTVEPGVTLVEVVSADNVSIASGGGLVNNATIRKTQAPSGVGDLSFGLTGVVIHIASPGSLASIRVDRNDQDHPNATSAIMTGKHWLINETASANDWTVDILLPHAGLPDPKVCKYPGNLGGFDWDCDRASYDSSIVRRDGITSFSDWAVGNDVGPTAISLRSLSVRNATALPLLPAAVLAGSLVLIAGRLAWKRRK